MRAIVYDRYGPPEVLELRELPSPVPGKEEVLVEVRAAALNPKDSLIRKGKFKAVTGARFPRQLGYDVAGVVRAVGPGFSIFRPGDEVYGMKNGFAGGTVAEEVCLPSDELALKPKRLSFEEAAGVPLTALTALQALRDEGGLTQGQRVLIHGASGGVGVYAIQIARLLGAHVTTTSSARNLDFCKQLGANEARDYATQPGLSSGSSWDVFFDVFGNRSFGKVRSALAARGTYVSTVPSLGMAVQHVLTRFFGDKHARLVVVKSNRADLEQLTRWIDDGKLNPVIDRVLPLTEVAQAQAHVETRRARGKVVIQVSSSAA